MRSLPGLLLLTSLLTFVLTASYTNTVSGSQTASAESGTIAFNLNATGDLPGMLNVKLNHEGGNVTGGSWTLTVLPANADAASSESGRITGTFSGGTITLDSNGIATAAGSIQLSVQSGTGQFESVTSGNGSLSLAADAENSTKLGGPLTLNF